MTNIDLYSTFFPGHQIEDPKRFAGRRGDIERALKSLYSPGASMVVFGERGVGKSSFVEMIKKIASGDTYLLFKFNLHKVFPPEKLNYKIISLECDSDANTTTKVLQRLITSPLGIRNLVSKRIEKTETTMKDKWLVDLLKVLSIGNECETKVISSEYQEESIFETFTNLIHTISKNLLHANEGLLIVIDEFDLVEDSSKMSSLIKTLSKNNVKFLISGIAESYEQLLLGHVSITRQLIYGRINILPMNACEIEDLFDIVTKNSNNQIRFDKSFVEHVIDKSGGYPYFVQLFGQLALEHHINEKGLQVPLIIHSQDLKKGIKKMGEFEYQMEKDYLTTIKENPLKEFILKFIAKSISKKIHDDEIYRFCFKHKIMQPTPKNTIASILGQREPQVLIRENDESKYVSFINPLFKTYVHSREPELYKIDKEKVIFPNDLISNLKTNTRKKNVIKNKK